LVDENAKELAHRALVVEEIPNEDAVSRLIDFPHKYDDFRHLILDTAFVFTKSKGTGEYTGESVNWSKYCATAEAIHALGCAWQKAKRERKPDMRYVGYIAAGVADIRQVESNRGHRFQVVHAPEDGQGLHHAEVRYLPNAVAGARFESIDREELKLALRQKFGDLVAHDCEE